jgi:N-acetyl-gamma-glutamyl-phosphate reductase
MNVAIVGATGYGGIQAVNLLKKNKNYKISFLGGNKTSGSKWNDNFPLFILMMIPILKKFPLRISQIKLILPCFVYQMVYLLL